VVSIAAYNIYDLPVRRFLTKRFAGAFARVPVP
jgi:hypothetical protein